MLARTSRLIGHREEGIILGATNLASRLVRAIMLPADHISMLDVNALPTVAELVLKAARKRSAAIEIVEWPGGVPKHIELGVTPEVFAAVRRGRKTVPLGKQLELAEVAGLPWCCTATLKSGGEALHRVVGPAIRQPDQWVLPIMSDPHYASDTIADHQKEADKLRRSFGLNAALRGK